MILAVDAGNTRIKWGAHVHGGWQANGACATAQAIGLAGCWDTLARPDRVIVSNVAGEPVRSAIVAASARFGHTPSFIESRAAQCGVRSSYEQPDQLGCDRWAALSAAHRL